MNIEKAWRRAPTSASLPRDTVSTSGEPRFAAKNDAELFLLGSLSHGTQCALRNESKQRNVYLIRVTLISDPSQTAFQGIKDKKQNAQEKAAAFGQCLVGNPLEAKAWRTWRYHYLVNTRPSEHRPFFFTDAGIFETGSLGSTNLEVPH